MQHITETNQGLSAMAIQDRNDWLDEYQAMLDESESAALDWADSQDSSPWDEFWG